jgi:hypothetical protein
MKTIKSRLQNGFLKVTVDGKIYLAWFPYWVTLSPGYREDLRKLDKSVVTVENEKGLSRSIEIDNNSLMYEWLQNKSSKKCREELVKAVVNLFEKVEL